MSKPWPKFAIGELVKLRSPSMPELNRDCVEILNSRYATNNKKVDGSPASAGWKYQMAHQPFHPVKTKKRLWFAESSLHKIDGPKQSVTDFLSENFPSMNKKPVEIE